MDISHIQIECEEYPGLLCEILLVPQNIVMNLNIYMIPILILYVGITNSPTYHSNSWF